MSTITYRTEPAAFILTLPSTHNKHAHALTTAAQAHQNVRIQITTDYTLTPDYEPDQFHWDIALYNYPDTTEDDGPLEGHPIYRYDGFGAPTSDTTQRLQEYTDAHGPLTFTLDTRDTLALLNGEKVIIRHTMPILPY
jgi:hypothetical protein